MRLHGFGVVLRGGKQAERRQHIALAGVDFRLLLLGVVGGEVGFGEGYFAVAIVCGMGGRLGREEMAGKLIGGLRFGCGGDLGFGGLRLVKIGGFYDFGRGQRAGLNDGGRGDGNAGDGRRGSLKRGLVFFSSFFSKGQRQAVGLGGEARGVFGLMFTRGGGVGVGEVCPDFALGDSFQAAFVVKRACPRLRLGQGGEVAGKGVLLGLLF